MSQTCSCIAGGAFLQCCGKDTADQEAYRFLLCLGNDASRPFHDRWSRHRDLVKKLVDQAAGGIRRGRCLVLGAGNCNDIPLDHLTDTFVEVVLFDLDASAMTAGTARLSPQQRTRCRLLAGDLTGLHSSGVAEALARRARHGLWPELEQYLRTLRKKIQPLPPAELDSGYDLVVSVCVATQLFVPFIRAVAAKSPLQDRIHARAADISRTLSNRLGELMHRSVKPEGAVAFATDILEWNAARLGLNGVAPLAPDSEMVDPIAVDELLRTHSHLKNVGAVPDNLTTLFTPAHVVDWIWAFSDRKQYVVRGFVLYRK